MLLLAEDGQTEWPSTILTTTVLFSSTFGLDNVVHYVEKTNGLGIHNLFLTRLDTILLFFLASHLINFSCLHSAKV